MDKHRKNIPDIQFMQKTSKQGRGTTLLTGHTQTFRPKNTTSYMRIRLGITTARYSLIRAAKTNSAWTDQRMIFISASSFKYPTMKTSEIMKIPIHEICNDDCLLFMWTTNPHLEHAINLGNAWGFQYRTVGFIWNKMRHNPGKYTMSNCELCLIFKRGRIPIPRGARNLQQLVNIPRGRHSEKPAEISEAIKKMFPYHKRIELFARRKLDGWDSWGLDMNVDYSNG